MPEAGKGNGMKTGYLGIYYHARMGGISLWVCVPPSDAADVKKAIGGSDYIDDRAGVSPVRVPQKALYPGSLVNGALYLQI